MQVFLLLYSWRISFLTYHSKADSCHQKTVSIYQCFLHLLICIKFFKKGVPFFSSSFLEFRPKSYLTSEFWYHLIPNESQTCWSLSFFNFSDQNSFHESSQFCLRYKVMFNFRAETKLPIFSYRYIAYLALFFFLGHF